MLALNPTSPSDAANAKFRWIDRVCTDRKIGHLACRIASLMVRYFNAKAGCAWPSQSRLADAAGVTVRSVQNALKALARRGHLSILKRSGQGNRYQFKLAKAASPPTAEQANGRSKSGERGFAQFHETPLKGTDAIERAAYGRELQDLAARIAARPPGFSSRQVVR
jgi:DNA-binding transcriptional MocR family regulator